MAIRIHCPRCQTTLTMQDNMYGKAVRCPQCQQPFQCPSVPATGTPAAAPPPVRKPPPAPIPRATPVAPPPSAANPFDFAQPTPTPPADADYSPSPRRRLVGWHRVCTGFPFLWLGAGAFVLSFLIFFFLSLDVPGPQEGPRSENILKLALLLGTIFSLAATYLGTLGQARCAAVPSETGAKPYATLASLCMGTCALASTLLALLVLPGLLGANFSPMPEVVPLLMLLSLGTFATSFILFIFFLTICLQRLQCKNLLASTVAFVVVIAVSPLIVLAISYLQVLAGGPSFLGRVGSLIPYLMLLIVSGGAGWFSLLLVGFNSAIRQAQRRGRA